jgi:hypothetical protein
MRTFEIPMLANFVLNFVFFFLIFYSSTFIYRLYHRLDMKDFVVCSPENMDLICLAVYAAMMAYIVFFA